MSDLEVIQFENNGPADTDLVLWDPIPGESLTAGNPVQHGHTYFNDSTGTLTAGVWTCTRFTTKLAPYPVNEFMCVLEGSVTIIDKDGHEETVRAGESFVVPQGMPSIWKQTEDIRKIYVIFDDPSGQTPENSSSLSVRRLDPTGIMIPIEPDESGYIGGIPEQHVHPVFTDMTGQMTVGIADTTEMHTKPLPFVRNELMHLLEGSVTITSGDGVARTFSAGDTFLVPQGMTYQWDSEGYVKKIFCIFQAQEVLAKVSGDKGESLTENVAESVRSPTP